MEVFRHEKEQDRVLSLNSFRIYISIDSSDFSNCALWNVVEYKLNNSLACFCTSQSRLCLLYVTIILREISMKGWNCLCSNLIDAFCMISSSYSEFVDAGGLIWVSEWNALQHPVASAFLAVLYSDYMLSSRTAAFSCSGRSFRPSDLRKFATSQVCSSLYTCLGIHIVRHLIAIRMDAFLCF